ncbi:MAG TPA: hypothetical protein VFY79_09770 [Dehalococcoidia bacterium]|nr:hypothetical protein [Dehalococcoidia bacterium]
MIGKIALPLIVGMMTLTAGFYAACGSDSSPTSSAEPTSTAVPKQTPTIAPQHTPAATEPTGVKAIDDAIVAIRAGDIDALIDLMVLAPEACAPANGAGGPPACNAGEAAGTKVNAVPFFSCEGGWAREEALHQALAPLTQGEPKLFAVYRSDQKLFARGGDYAVLFTYTTTSGDVARDLVMTDDGVVGIDAGCGQTAAQMVDQHKLTDAIYLRGG